MSESKPASTELTGGAGFTYEDTVGAYYLAQLLTRGRAAAQSGLVTSVAVQQQGHGNPMDDLVVEFDEAGTKRTLGLQIKRSITISAADKDFCAIVAAAVKTQVQAGFGKDADKCGFIVEHVSDAALRTLNRLTSWAGDSLTSAEFDERFKSTGAAAKAEINLRDALKPLIGATNLDEEISFYKHFVALRFDGLEENGARRADIINRLQEQVATTEDGQGLLLFDRLCRIIREGSANGAKWTRDSLVAELRGAVRLKLIPFLAEDIGRLNAFSLEALKVVSETIDEFHVERPALQNRVAEQLELHRVVTIGGLPGCGKSAVLMRFAQRATADGPILFLKTDRLAGTSWTQFAASMGLSVTSATTLLGEIGTTGTPILFIDGIDRVRPDQQGIIRDLVNAIHSNPNLSNWKVLVTSRDQGLEAFRAWFPTTMYKNTGIGDVPVNPFSEDEAEALAQSKPHLRKVLFGAQAVQDIARRPFFAAVLSRSVAEDTDPQTEVDLISAWWARAGHDALAETIPQRQRALIDLAERGVRNLGKGIPARDLKDATIAQVAALKSDQIIREERRGASLAFTHDIFFEWTFFRLLVELGEGWTTALIAAGEPPLLGRVIGLMAQDSLTEKGHWSDGYRSLSGKRLRRQWQREWLTAPPFTPAFESAKGEFGDLLKADDYVLFEKVLVWFQAQHTIPSPFVLGNIKSPVEGLDNLAIADLLGWPSDFPAWGRLIDWIIGEASSIPVRLIPRVLAIFDVWQNVVSDLKNPRSKSILALVNTWLLRFENGELQDNDAGEKKIARRFRRDESSHLAKSLRAILLRSARSYPQYAIDLFKRTIADEDRRQAVYADLIEFSPIMVQVDPDVVADLAEAELFDELPEDELIRKEQERNEYYERLRTLRAIPEDKRTDSQKRELSSHSMFHAIGSSRFGRDHIGIQQHNNFYFPVSALHEPFKSLFATRPDIALRLIRNLSNRAIEGWRQIHRINSKEMGTPIPVSVNFPWGSQEFWGDWHVFNWGMGQLAPQPLECAFLSLNYWAFKQLESGRSPSDVIKDIVTGNDCYAVLGIALRLALETLETTETTLALVTCQRLWHHDIARSVHEPNKDIDLFGMGFLSRLTGEKAEAKEFLDKRKSRIREIRSLTIFFALNKDNALSESFRDALARFPHNLPYDLEEQKTNDRLAARWKEDAERWAGLGDRKNYKQSQYDEKYVAISYESPTPLTDSGQARLDESTATLKSYNTVGWVVKSFEGNALADGMSLQQAIAYAKSVDTETAFDIHDESASSPQSVIASVAACVIRFGNPQGEDADWAWESMARIEAMKEIDGKFGGSRIPWHPKVRLVIALHHDRHSLSPRTDSAARLLKLTLHPLESVSDLAFNVLFADKDNTLRWIAGQLAANLCIVHRGDFTDAGWDWRPDSNARAESLARALAALEKNEVSPMPVLPPAWVKGGARSRRRENGEQWSHPNIFFDGQSASKSFSRMPVGAWMGSDVFRPLFEAFLLDLISWTAESLMPSWRTEDDRYRDNRQTELLEWNRVLADLMARASPFVSLETARDSFVKPFLPFDEDALCVLANFADQLVLRHICDAELIPANAIPLLDECASRVLQDRTFNPNGWRAGQVNGYDMPKLIKALLFVNFEEPARGAARFANGDWSEIDKVMPIIDRVVTHVGWAAFVMGKFLDLCQRVGRAYPIAMFGKQASTALSAIGNAEEGWAGTLLPARMAGVVQRLADWNFPLRLEDAQELLNVLDALIDLGDRRSAALEQTEAFRGIQGRASV